MPKIAITIGTDLSRLLILPDPPRIIIAVTEGEERGYVVVEPEDENEKTLIERLAEAAASGRAEKTAIGVKLEVKLKKEERGGVISAASRLCAALASEGVPSGFSLLG